MRIISFNANGLRSAATKGFFDWFAAQDADVLCVHGTDDSIVPIEISERYVEAASAAGGDASLTAVEGDHFVVIDPESDAWERTLRILDDLV